MIALVVAGIIAALNVHWWLFLTSEERAKQSAAYDEDPGRNI